MCLDLTHVDEDEEEEGHLHGGKLDDSGQQVAPLSPYDGDLGVPSNYFLTIVESILRHDKYRSKLLKRQHSGSSLGYEEAFPQRHPNEQYHYLASGSYAQVFRHVISDDTPDSALPPGEPRRSIIKLMVTFSENLLKNLAGTRMRGSFSTFRDAYNEFKICEALSLLNPGLIVPEGLCYSCPLFPTLYRCVVLNGAMPCYFDRSGSVAETDQRLGGKLDYRALLKRRKRWRRLSSSAVSPPEPRHLGLPQPEVVALQMEECGEPLHDLLRSLTPEQILSLAKQMLLGFLVAEDALLYEHRDLHLGNVLAKSTNESVLYYRFRDKAMAIPSHGLVVKVIDTTFSRLTYKKQVLYRDLSHLFHEDEVCGRDDLDLSRQENAYQAMAREVGWNWPGHFPRTNLIWLCYLLRKLLRSRPLRKNTTITLQVRTTLALYADLLQRELTLESFWKAVAAKPGLNQVVPLTISTLQPQPCAENHENVDCTELSHSSPLLPQ